MAEELVLVPKYKYNVLMERAGKKASLEQVHANGNHCRTSAKNSESNHTLPVAEQKIDNQTGGRAGTINEEIPGQEKKLTLYVEKPLSKLKFGTARVRQQKSQWINYLG